MNNLKCARTNKEFSPRQTSPPPNEETVTISFFHDSKSPQSLEDSQELIISNFDSGMPILTEASRRDTSGVNNVTDDLLINNNQGLPHSSYSAPAFDAYDVIMSNHQSEGIIRSNLSSDALHLPIASSTFSRPCSLPETPLKLVVTPPGSLSVDMTVSSHCDTLANTNSSGQMNCINSNNSTRENGGDGTLAGTPQDSGMVGDMTGQLDGDSCVSDRSNRSQRSGVGVQSVDMSAGTKKWKSNWYNKSSKHPHFALADTKALSPSYKSKMENFRRIFKDSAVEHERLLVDYSCALSKNNNGFLMQGRMYVTENWICFYSKIISFEQKIILAVRDIKSISKERTAKVFPNAIQFEYGDSKEKYFFTSFGSRDRTYNTLHKVWQDRKNHKVLSQEDFWDQVHENYGDDLGLTVHDDDILKSDLRAEDDCLKHLESAAPPPNVDDGGSMDDNASTSAAGSTADAGEELGMLPPLMQNELDIGALEEMELEEGDEVEVEDDEQDGMPDKEEVYCSGHEHIGRELVNEVIPMNIDDLFTCIFTDSQFFAAFCQVRMTYNISQSAWPDEADENGEKERTIYYTLTLNNSIGPKISSSVEKQVLLNVSDACRIYVIDAKVRNGGVPYCDSFHVVNRYCLNHVSANQSRIKVTSKVIYDKTIFFPARSMIENSAKNGLAEYFKCLVNALRDAAKSPSNLRDSCSISGISVENVTDVGSNVHDGDSDTIPGPSSANSPTSNDNPIHLEAGSRKGSLIQGEMKGKKIASRRSSGLEHLQYGDLSSASSRRSRRSGRETGRRTTWETHNSGFFFMTASSLFEGFLKPERACVGLVIMSLILCLCVSVVYNRFLQLEALTLQLYSPSPAQFNHFLHTFPRPTDSSHPTSQTGNSEGHQPTNWAQLLSEQNRLHTAEIKRWKAVIDSTINVMDEMKNTLLVIRNNVDALEKQSEQLHKSPENS